MSRKKRRAIRICEKKVRLIKLQNNDYYDTKLIFSNVSTKSFVDGEE